jgi:hypothetical protein
VTGPTPSTVADVDARPVVMTRIAIGLATVIFVTFTVTALLLPHDSGGAHVAATDPIAVFISGVILTLLALVPTRLRLHADADGVHLRSFFTSWHTIPWDVVLRVEFPSSVRFARLVLPAEETVPLFPVQRLDGARAVETMRQLRALHAAQHPGDR